jgi:hypothetical protein
MNERSLFMNENSLLMNENSLQTGRKTLVFREFEGRKMEVSRLETDCFKVRNKVFQGKKQGVKCL